MITQQQRNKTAGENRHACYSVFEMYTTFKWNFWRRKCVLLLMSVLANSIQEVDPHSKHGFYLQLLSLCVRIPSRGSVHGKNRSKAAAKGNGEVEESMQLYRVTTGFWTQQGEKNLEAGLQHTCMSKRNTLCEVHDRISFYFQIVWLPHCRQPHLIQLPTGIRGGTYLRKAREFLPNLMTILTELQSLCLTGKNLRKSGPNQNGFLSKKKAFPFGVVAELLRRNKNLWYSDQISWQWISSYKLHLVQLVT